MQEPTFRVLSEDDVAKFRVLRLRGLKEDSAAFGASYEETVVMTEAALAARLTCDSGRFVVGAFMDNVENSAVSAGPPPFLVGMVGLFRDQSDKGRHKATVWGMYVAPEARGKGVARSLMLELIGRAKTMPGLEELLLTVSVPQAKQLYISLGFETYGREARAIKMKDGEYVDEELMYRPL